ncbi:MAG: hydrogenase, partial [Acidaminococcaceae bacterium]
GLLTIVVKVCVIPYALWGLVRKLTNAREISYAGNGNYATLASAFFMVLAYLVVDKMLPGIGGRNIMASALVVMLTGLTLIVLRSRAIMQIVGLITMENGIYLLGMAMTEGLPLVIELGIFFDVLVAVVVLVILTNKLNLSLMTTDTKVLRKLKG